MPSLRQGRPPAPHARRGRSAEARPRRAAHRPRLDRLLDPIKVEVYGAQHAAQPGRDRLGARAALLSVQVWDKSNVSPVEKAIRSAGLGLNPITDGQMIRLPIPDLTEERRKELAKLAGQYAEKARIAVRNVRRDGMDALKADEKKHEISEDERKRLEAEVQKLTDDDDRRDRRRGATPRKRKSSASDAQPPPRPRACRRPRIGGAGSGAAPCRDHHGRQRPLGDASAACRASPAIAPGPKRCARRSRRAVERGRRGAHALRLLVGELAPLGGGDRRPHRADALLSRARA